MSIKDGPKITTDGLVLALDAGNRFSYPGSGNTWSDLSGNGNNGTLINGPTYDSGNAGSIVFDRSDDYGLISSLTHESYNNDFTVNVWVKPVNLNTGYFGIAGWGDSGKGPYYLWGLGINNFKFRTQVYNGSNYYVESATIESDKIYNVHFVVRQSGIMTLFVNLNSTTTVGSSNLIRSRTLNDTYNRTNIGIGANQGFGKMLGSIYSLNIYNRALTASEILQNYNSTKTRFGL